MRVCLLNYLSEVFQRAIGIRILDEDGGKVSFGQIGGVQVAYNNFYTQ